MSFNVLLLYFAILYCRRIAVNKSCLRFWECRNLEFTEGQNEMYTYRLSRDFYIALPFQNLARSPSNDTSSLSIHIWILLCIVYAQRARPKNSKLENRHIIIASNRPCHQVGAITHHQSPPHNSSTHHERYNPRQKTCSLQLRMDNCSRRCNDCKEWTKPCFACRFAELQETHGLRLNVEDSQIEQITGFEFLSRNLVPYRRTQLLRNNEPLASAVMLFSDNSVLPHTKELALDVYLEALSHHSGLIGLNARVIAFLVYLHRDTEAISFTESLSQWSTMRFNKDIWLQCLDSTMDEVRGIENLPLATQIALAIVKARVVAELRADQEALSSFLDTDRGSLLGQAGSVLAEILGRDVLMGQERQLQSVFKVIDDRDSSLRVALAGVVEVDEDRKRGVEQELTGSEGPLHHLLIWNTLQVSICRRHEVKSIFGSDAS